MNSKSVKPLYQQIEASIRSDIQTHIYKTGDKLPTETELSAKYNVSKITIRKAMEKLSHNGLIQKVQGKVPLCAHKRTKLPSPRQEDLTIPFPLMATPPVIKYWKSKNPIR